MSNNEYENGTFTLPTAAVAPLKKLLREDQNAHRERIFAEAKRVHVKIKTTSREKYQKELTRRDDTNWNSVYDWAAIYVLEGMLRRRGDKPPVTPIVADMDAILPEAKSTTTEFRILTKHDHNCGVIRFKGREVTWSVWENNRAVDHAHSGSTAKVFFGYLDRLTWTRGTGGYTMYDSEYNEDSMGNRTGASLSATWGPLGERQKVWDLQTRGFSLAQAKKYAKAR